MVSCIISWCLKLDNYSTSHEGNQKSIMTCRFRWCFISINFSWMLPDFFFKHHHNINFKLNSICIQVSIDITLTQFVQHEMLKERHCGWKKWMVKRRPACYSLIYVKSSRHFYRVKGMVDSMTNEVKGVIKTKCQYQWVWWFISMFSLS